MSGIVLFVTRFIKVNQDNQRKGRGGNVTGGESISGRTSAIGGD
jgi:hypothetical protein